MDGLPMIFSIVGALFGLIATTLMGMAVSRLDGIGQHLEKLNGQFFDHITKPSIHEAGFAKTEEQISHLLQTVTVAHERIDRMALKT